MVEAGLASGLSDASDEGRRQRPGEARSAPAAGCAMSRHSAVEAGFASGPFDASDGGVLSVLRGFWISIGGRNFDS